MGIIHCCMVLSGNWPATIWSNIFLGLQQGLCWSMLIFTMVDYAGPSNRALAVGLNESFGYVGVAVFGKIGPLIWGDSAPRDGDDAKTIPYYAMLGFMVFGLITCLTVLKNSKPVAQAEQSKRFDQAGVTKFSETVITKFPSGKTKETSVFRFAFAETSFLNNSLMSCCLVGIAINYCSAFAWGLGKSWAKAGNGTHWDPMTSTTADDITLTYDLAKGVLQFIVGFYSDRFGRRPLICAGMVMISVALTVWGFIGQFAESTETAKNGFFVAAFMLGSGTAMMYPVVIAAVGESADPSWRSSAMGSYRFWRDSGYAIGGLLLGYATDNGGYATAVFVTAAIMLSITINFFFVYEEVVEGGMDLTKINEEFEAGKIGEIGEAEEVKGLKGGYVL